MSDAAHQLQRGIALAHPTRQHSHHLATALDRAGMLQLYLTMMPNSDSSTRWPWNKVIASAAHRLGPVEIDPGRLHCWSHPWVLKRGLDAVLPSGRGLRSTEIWTYAVFDWWVASNIKRFRPSIFVGYEMASAASFGVAKSLGTLCILDAAACSSAVQDRLLETEKKSAATAIGKMIRRRKAMEIKSADVIICCSEMARQSYLDLGVPTERVLTNPLGCQSALFSAHKHSASGVPKFCFVGTASETKGFADLLASFALHRAENPSSELHIIGDTRAAQSFGLRRSEGGIVPHGKKTHVELAQILSGMDVLVLPSLLESFGMVVPEALAAGAYVILSHRVGAASFVSDQRVGTIVPAGDLDRLTSAMTRTARDIERVRKDAHLRRSIAQSWDWRHYQDRAIQIFGPLLRREARFDAGAERPFRNSA